MEETTTNTKQTHSSKADLVAEWRKQHPDGNKSECASDLKISRSTVTKYWEQEQNCIKDEMKTNEYIYEGQIENHPICITLENKPPQPPKHKWYQQWYLWFISTIVLAVVLIAGALFVGLTYDSNSNSFSDNAGAPAQTQTIPEIDGTNSTENE